MPCRMSLIKSFPTFLFPHYRYCAPLGLGAILSRDCLAVDGKRCQPCAFATSPMKARLLCCALFFQTGIWAQVSRQEFHPAPRLDTALLCLRKKAQPDLPWDQRAAYREFIRRSWSQGSPFRLTKKQAATALRLEDISPIPRDSNLLYVPVAVPFSMLTKLLWPGCILIRVSLYGFGDCSAPKGVRPDPPGAGPAGQGREYWFALNLTGKAQPLPACFAGDIDLLTGRDATAEMEPFDGMVFYR